MDTQNSFSIDCYGHNMLNLNCSSCLCFVTVLSIDLLKKISIKPFR